MGVRPGGGRHVGPRLDMIGLLMEGGEADGVIHSYASSEENVLEWLEGWEVRVSRSSTVRRPLKLEKPRRARSVCGLVQEHAGAQGILDYGTPRLKLDGELIAGGAQPGRKPGLFGRPWESIPK